MSRKKPKHMINLYYTCYVKCNVTVFCIYLVFSIINQCRIGYAMSVFLWSNLDATIFIVGKKDRINTYLHRAY